MKNTYKVPMKKWNKWGETARHVFNETYRSVNAPSRCLFPESAGSLPRSAVRVIAWNTAWIAADAAAEKWSKKDEAAFARMLL